MFMLFKFNDFQRKYVITEKEFLVVLLYLEEVR